MPPDDFSAVSYAVAGAIGLLLGFEREHHEWREHQAPVATGTRTLAIVSLSGAVAATIDPVVVGSGAVAVGLLLAVGYWRSDRTSIGETTEFTGLICFLLGALSMQHAGVAAGLAAAVAVLLESKGRMRNLVRSIVTPREVEDAVRWFALAFVVLPLMPDRGYGPDAVLNPAQIWRLFLVLTGIGWLGHIGTRAVGERRGMLIAGAAGGFISGAATTATLARVARREPALTRPALSGALLASVATCVQLVVMVSITSPQLGRWVVAPMAAGAVTLSGTAVLMLRGVVAGAALADEETQSPRPLALKGSIIGACLLTAAVGGSALLAKRVGTGAVLPASAATGLADVHAAALGVAALVGDQILTIPTAVGAIGLALAANTVTKIVLAFVGGGARFARRFTVALLPAVAVVTVGLWMVHRRAGH